MAEPNPNKPQLRTLLRQRRRALGNDTRELAARQLAQHLADIPRWHRARHVALYASIGDEISTSALLRACLDSGKKSYLPVVREDRNLEFARWTEGDPRGKNRFDIPEPTAAAERRATAQLDIIFLPLLGWDRSGTRLGVGGGYYDHTLRGISGPLLIGLAFAAQEVGYIPRDNWDIALDAVLTEGGVHSCPTANGYRDG